MWEHRKWLVASAQARGVLASREPNPVGKRTGFVHPGGLKKCEVLGEQAKSGALCKNTSAGLRWMPVWIVAPGEGGLARN